MEAPASSAKGDALEQQLTSQVEADAEASLTGEAGEQLPQTGMHYTNACVMLMPWSRLARADSLLSLHCRPLYLLWQDMQICWHLITLWLCCRSSGGACAATCSRPCPSTEKTEEVPAVYTVCEFPDTPIPLRSLRRLTQYPWLLCARASSP